MKKIKVKADLYIIAIEDMPADELSLRTEMALNSMGPLTIGGKLMFQADRIAALRFHFKGDPEILIGEEKEK